MSEYTPLELSPALEWLVAQAATNPKAVEDGHKAFNLVAAMPGDVGDGDADEAAQVTLFHRIFDNPRLRAVMRQFWTTYREEKAAGNIRSVSQNEDPWL